MTRRISIELEGGPWDGRRINNLTLPRPPRRHLGRRLALRVHTLRPLHPPRPTHLLAHLGRTHHRPPHHAKRRTMSLSPTQLTLKHLRNNGWPAVAVVERWNQHAGIRQDLFGFIDVLAVGPNGTLAVQTTSASHVAERVTKIADSPLIGAVREAGWAIHVHGWEKKKGRWVLQREVDVS